MWRIKLQTTFKDLCLLILYDTFRRYVLFINRLGKDAQILVDFVPRKRGGGDIIGMVPKCLHI